MQTITVDIINERVLPLLKNLEGLKLIRIRKSNILANDSINFVAKYKGAMRKQPIEEVDNQLKELRNSWE